MIEHWDSEARDLENSPDKKIEIQKPKTYYILVRPKGTFPENNRFISINKSTPLDTPVLKGWTTFEDITVTLVDNISDATLFVEELQDALNMVKFFYSKKDYIISVATIVPDLM